MPVVSTLAAASSRGFGEFSLQQVGNYVESVFGTYIYNGTGSPQTITNNIDISGEGGMVWIKGRSTISDHAIYDTSRGATYDIGSNLATGQTTEATGLTSFSGSGFNIGALSKVNTNSQIYTSWTFRKQQRFFDIVTYTGNGVNRSISHDLGSIPGMILIKRTDTTSNWAVYHRSLANTEYLVLNTTAAKATGATYWNSTTPTSTAFTVGTAPEVNAENGTYVAYLFAHDAGGFGKSGTQNVISCGTFTTSFGSANVTLGWEPQFLLVKQISATSSWTMFDNVRGNASVNGTTTNEFPLNPNATTAEYSAYGLANPTSTGFQVTGYSGAATFVYMAIRRGPMEVPALGTKVFIPTVYTGTNLDNRLINTTISPDLVWVRQRDSTTVNGMVVGDRLRGQPYLLTGATGVEVNDIDSFDQQLVGSVEYGSAFASMNGVWVGNDTTSQLNASTTPNNQIIESFKRAPNFLDIVCYTGNNSNRTVNHNLESIPELMLIRRRSNLGNAWAVYSSAIGNTQYLTLNTDAAKATGATYWNNTTPTSSVFSLGSSSVVNNNNNLYVAYLWATCPGVSKVGSYSGTGFSQQIDCGFTSSARFILIKRTDSLGNWYLYDSARGIVSGNDPYILLNSINAETTNTDYIDAYSFGFEISGTAPAGINEAFSTTSQTSGFGTTNINSVAYGNNLFVAAGDSGTMTISGDAITWSSAVSGFGTSNINGVTYGGGLFVAVGIGGKITTSSNAVLWTLQTSGTGNALNDVAYGNNLYVAVGSSGTLLTSPDGITWTSRTSGFGSTTIRGVGYGNGLFVAVGDSGVMTTSTDGVTWTSRTSGFGSTRINNVVYGNGVFVAVGGSGKITTSSDGITWTARSSGVGTTVILNIAYGGTYFVAVGANGTAIVSVDGITWQDQSTGFGASSINGIAYKSNFFVLVGDSGNMVTTGPSSYIYLAIA